MNTLHFQYVLEVARTQSISQAAENLFMAQPNLSKAIRELESSLNITIFERSSKGVVPTPQGAAFLEYASNVLAEVEKMKQIQTSVNKHRLDISIPLSFSICEAVTEFIKKNEDTQLAIDIKQQRTLEAVESVMRNSSRIAMVRVESQSRENLENYCREHDLNTSLIWEYAAKVTVSKDSILANKQVATNEMLKSMIRICEEGESLPFEMPHKTFFSGTKTINVNNLMIIKDIMQTSDKYWMWDAPVTREYRKKSSISQLSSENSYKLCDFFIFKKSYRMTEEEKLFLDCVYSIKNTIEFMQK